MFAAAFGVLMTASIVAAPQTAAAAACRYIVQDLPVPAGGYVQATGSSTDNSRIVATVGLDEDKYGVLWVNGALHMMTPSGSPTTGVFAWAINNTGVVAGRHEVSLGSQGTLYKAFRYENGAYEFLQTEPGEQSSAWGINDAGDVVGQVWRESDPNVRTVVMWSRDGARKSYGEGMAIGINAQRKIVMTTTWSAWVVDADTGAKIELPGGRHPIVFDNDRVLHYERIRPGVLQIAEWDLNGARVGAYAGGRLPHGKNSSGTLFGTFGAITPSLWNKSVRTSIVADKLPDPDYYGDVTDAATLIGSYDEGAGPRPAQWLWVCS